MKHALIQTDDVQLLQNCVATQCVNEKVHSKIYAFNKGFAIATWILVARVS